MTRVIPRGDARTDTPAESEAQLVARVRRGIPEALAALYERFAEQLYRLAWRVSGSPDEAEDVVHDLFLGLPELLRCYEDRGRLDAWLRAVTVRLALARMRRDRRRDRLLAGAETPVEVAGVTDPGDRVDLSRALSALAEPLRLVFVLRQLEGYTHEEIGQLIGITSGASRVRFSRALSRLRHLLEPDR